MKREAREASLKDPGADAVAPWLASWFSRDRLLGLVLVLAVILAYLPVWRTGFIWDDDKLITANPCLVGPLGLKEIWTTAAADICPLTITTFWVEHALWGVAPLPYHLVTVFMHALCAVLLWRVLRSLQAPGAWLGAALWALHPLQVESVAWVTEMKNTESGLFFLLSILFFIKWLGAQNLDPRTGAGWNYAWTLLFAALAMASKSSTVILPVVFCLCAWWIEGRWRWRNLTRVAPVILMSAVACALSIWTQGFQLAKSADSNPARPWPERLVEAGDAVWFYLGKLVWPHPLVTIYPRWQIDAGQVFSYLPLLAVIVVLFILWLNRASWARPWFFVFALYLLALLPVLGLVDNYLFRYAMVFDHLQYLAGMAPLALVGAGMVRLAKHAVPNRPRLQSSLCAGVLLVLGTLSWQRALVYESGMTLWTDTLAKNPNCWVAQNNLGSALVENGQEDAALPHFLRALAIDPHIAEVHYDLGVAFYQKGRLDEAVTQYQSALEINPLIPEANYKLGLALYKQGKIDAAMDYYQKALAIKPYYVEACTDLGSAHLQKGEVDAAMALYQRALQINPDFAEAHADLGVAFAQKKEWDAAIAQFQEALRLKPDYTNAQNNLIKAEAMEMQQSGRK
jgi:tetratricopeptide (TPR) repeat protein